MNKVFRGFARIGSLLRRRRFFLLGQAIANKMLPSCVLRMNQTILYKLSRKSCCSEGNNANIEVFRGDRQSVRKMVRDLYNNDPKTLAFYEHFYEQGFEPWIAQQGNVAVGVVWLFTDSYLAVWEGYDAWLLRFYADPGAKFLGNAFVSPQRRGQGLFTLMTNCCLTTYPEADFYSTVEATNTPSILSHKKIGFQPCGTVRSIRFFQQAFCLVVWKRRIIGLFRLRKGKETDITLSDNNP